MSAVDDSDLTILCVSCFERHAKRFLLELDGFAWALGARFVIGADSSGPTDSSPTWLAETVATIVPLESKGYIESVLDAAITACPRGYILRMDDDETISAGMFSWLAAGEYRLADHWAFPRKHLWPDAEHFIENEPLYPDLQTRLSVKEKAGGRTQIHVGSPFGTGQVAWDAPIEHHKFLARSRLEREALVARYEQLQPGGGAQFIPFSVPERFADQLVTRSI